MRSLPHLTMTVLLLALIFTTLVLLLLNICIFSPISIGRVTDESYFIRESKFNIENNIQESHRYESPILETKLTNSKQDTSISFEEPYRYYGEFQRLNDNLTYVCVGYYDDRDEEAVVKVIAEIPGKIDYNFSCTVYYRDKTMLEVTGYVKYFYCYVMEFVVNDKFRNGYIICPVSKQRGPPTFLRIGRSNVTLPKVKVTVKSPPNQKYRLTRCISPLVFDYTNVPQMIWSIELQRMFGVEKTIVYLDSQSKEVEEVLHSYERDGTVELRNFSIYQPGTPIIGDFMQSLYRDRKRKWGQWLAFNDCVLSQMKSAKYVILTDMDEGFVPRKHNTIRELADDIFEQSKHDTKPAGSLLFRNVFLSYLQEHDKQRLSAQGSSSKVQNRSTVVHNKDEN